MKGSVDRWVLLRPDGMRASSRLEPPGKPSSGADKVTARAAGLRRGSRRGDGRLQVKPKIKKLFLNKETSESSAGKSEGCNCSNQ